MAKADVFSELEALLGKGFCVPRKDETQVVATERVALKANKMSQPEWESLSEKTQVWINSVLTALDEKKGLPLLPGMPKAAAETDGTPVAAKKDASGKKNKKKQKAKAPAKKPPAKKAAAKKTEKAAPKKQPPKPAAKKKPASPAAAKVREAVPDTREAAEAVVEAGELQPAADGKALVDRAELIKLLTALKPALASGGSVVELGHVWFDGDFVYAYDGNFGLRIAYKSRGLDCGVPGAALMGLLGTSVAKSVGLELAGSALCVKFGKSTSKLATLESSRRIWPFPTKLPKVSIPLGEDFVAGLDKVLFIKARPATRVEHHGVMLQRSKQDLELLTTDTSTLAQVVLKGAAKGVDLEQALLPREFAEQLVAQAPGGVNLFVLDDCLVAEAEGISFYSNVLDLSTADNLSTLLAKHAANHAETVALPDNLVAAVTRAEILAGSEQPIVEASVRGAVLSLFGDYALGTLKEELPFEGELPQAKARLVVKQLRLALARAQSFSLTKETLLLRGEGNFTYLAASV